MSLNKDELSKIPVKDFGLPKEKKFPMHDEKHLRSAIAYFHTAEMSKRDELARNLIRRHKELGSSVKITSKNPLFKYVPDRLKSIEESDNSHTIAEVSERMRSIFDSQAPAIIESLMSRIGYIDIVDTVDDLDYAVSTDYAHSEYLVNTLKSMVMHEGSIDEFPLFYLDAPRLNLTANNGGINSLNESVNILRDYHGSMNEATSLNPVDNMEHIMFCGMLREWYEGYAKGHRNYTYDRLMIESWQARSIVLLESVITAGIPSYNGIDAESKQKLLDMGLDNVLHMVQNKDMSDDVSNPEQPILRAAKIGIQATADIKKLFFGPFDDPSILSPTLKLVLYTQKDDHIIAQFGQDITSAREKFL